MSLTILTVLLALEACMMSTAEAIRPNSNDISPVDACLYYCSECYKDDGKKMMQCANGVCPHASTSAHDFLQLLNNNDCSVDVVSNRLYRQNYFQ
uniref:Uncharacterized protein n=2 Tax=Octopus bimaculoides TaxID=37653 RepID=A0A0L8HG85_OCTBM